MKKRLLSMLLTICMVLSLLPTVAFASGTITLEINGTYNEADNTIGSDVAAYSGATLQAAITGVSLTSVKNLKITAGTVTAADWAYITNLTALEHFEIEDGVTVEDIPDTTSWSSTFPASIISVNIPQAIPIGACAFNYCTNLTTVSLPAVTSIGTSAFDSCGNLTAVSLPEVTSIGIQAFYACYNLTAVSLPAVTSIGENAFSYCTALTTLKLGATPPTVGTSAFGSVPQTNPLVLLDASGEQLTGDALTTAQSAYKAASDGDTTDVKWYGWTVTATADPISFQIGGTYGSADNTIGSDGTAYSGATLQAAITGVSLTSVKNLKITAGTVTADDWAYITNLTALEHFEIADGVTVEAMPDATSGSPIFPTSIISVNIPQAIPIVEYAFFDCTSLTTVSLPGVTSIGASAFDGCGNLTAVSLPKVTSIGASAFDSCGNLTAVSLPEVTSIENCTFNYCLDLTTVSLPKVTSIGVQAFLDCTKLTTVSLPKVTSIGDEAFLSCTALTTLKLGATPPTVGTSAFSGGVPQTNPLVLLDASGEQLTDDALTNAQSAYKAASDGDTTDVKWYGWTIITPTTPTIAAIPAQSAVMTGADLNASLTAPAVTDNGFTISAKGWQISADGSTGWQNVPANSTCTAAVNGNYLRYYVTYDSGTKIVYSANTVQLTVNTASIALDGVGYNVAAGTLTGTTTEMEYSLDGGGTWQDCAADSTTGLTFVAGVVMVRQKDKVTNEATVATLAAPAVSSTPTLESKTSGSVTLTSMAGYEYSKDGGASWQDSNVFSSLSSSTTYSFVARIKATAAALSGVTSSALSVMTNSASSGGTSSGGSSASSGTGAPVIVDGKTENIGTEKKYSDTTIVTVDQSKLGKNIDSASSGSSVVVSVSENGTAAASLVVKNIEDMAQKGMTLTVQTGSVAYNLNTSAIDTAALTAAFPDADMSKVPFDVTIQNSSVSVKGEALVLALVEFTVTVTYGDKTVSVDTFSAYIDRVIEVTAEQAAKITTAVVVNADGSTRHVPTNVIEKNGKYYAIIKSRTNSTYGLIQNEVTFTDASGKWYEAAVNEMGSRKIIEGRSASIFDGGASITRAEFAAILIRALGLPADGTSSFSDVSADAWYTGAVDTAVQYGLVAGKGKNRFDPTANITRQEAMLMLQRAAALTEFSGTSSALDGIADADSIGSWAEDATKWSVGSGLIQGANGKLNPTANITRAESATIILRLLQKADLVDIRS